MADTGFKSPSTNGTPATYGATSATEYTNAGNAYADDSNYATATDDEANQKQQSYGGFGFSIPAGAIITGIEMTAKAKTDTGSLTDCSPYIYQKSGDQWSSGTGGQAYTTTEATKTWGSSSYLWVLTGWLVSDFSDDNFAILWRSSSFDSPSGRVLSLNHIQVKVYYDLPASNIIIM